MQPVSHLALLVLLLVAAGEVIDSANVSTCTEEYQGYTKYLHTMCLTDHPGAVDVPLTQAEKDAAVNFHNEIRANVTPTASNMQKMVWDDNMAKVAAKWARQCQVGHDKNRSQPELNKYGLPVGQNLGAGHSSLNSAINLWYQELPLWVFGNWTVAAGHYIAEIYHASSRIGCGHAKCNDTYGNYWICNYFAGVYTNVDPYQQGASCSKCSNSCDASGKLCDCGGKFCAKGGTLDLNTCKCQCPRLWTGDECETLDCPKKRDFEEYCTYSSFTPETFCPNATVNDVYAKICPIRCGICPEPCQETVCQHNGKVDVDTCNCTCSEGFSGNLCETCPTEDNKAWCSYSSFEPEKSCPNKTYNAYSELCPIRCGICPLIMFQETRRGVAGTLPDVKCMLMNKGGKWLDFSCSKKKKTYVCKYLLA